MRSTMTTSTIRHRNSEFQASGGPGPRGQNTDMTYVACVGAFFIVILGRSDTGGGGYEGHHLSMNKRFKGEISSL